MGFSLKDAVSTAINPFNGPFIRKAFDTKYDTTRQVPLQSKEQKKARQMLNDFARTGRFGSFTAGQDLGLGIGDYNMTDPERTGLSTLQNLLRSGIPEQYRLGDDALRDLLNPSPEAIEAQFSPFKTIVDRQLRDSSDALKRRASFAGNLYSTDTIRSLGDIEARGNETLTAKLAELTNEALNRRLQAIPLAFRSGAEQEDIAMGRIGASQTYGSLTRRLNDERIKSRDAEILRRRQELQLPIQAASNVAGSNVQFGVPEIRTPQPNPYMDVLQTIIQIAPRLLAGGAGG